MRNRSLFVMLAITVAVAGTAANAAEPLAPDTSRHEANIAVNMLQSSYSRNWNGGDKGSVNWSVTFDGRHEKQMGAKYNWLNTLKLAYGQNHQQERRSDGELYWQRPDKNTDAIEFESMLKLTASPKWNPYLAFGFTSLFRDLSDADGRDQNFNPLTFSESAGVSRQLLATEKRSLTMRLGVALIQSHRSFFSEPAPSEATLSEAAYTTAAELVTEYRSQLLSDRVGWESKLRLDLPLTWSGKSVFEDGFVSIVPMPADIAGYTTTLDADWENTFSANITKVIAVKLFVRWVYDKYDNSVKPVVDGDGALVNEAAVLSAIRPAGQFKQTLALGFGYKF